MITAKPLLAAAGVSVTVFDCDGSQKPWSREENVTEYTLTIVQGGSFRRRVNGSEILAHPLIGYIEQPGVTHQFEHPVGGDICTGIGLSERVMGSMLDPARLPSDAVLHLEPHADLACRLLLRRIGDGADQDVLIEHTMVLAGRLLESHASEPGHPPASHRRIAERAREALCVEPHLSLRDLAAMLGVSMYQVSRIFRSMNGCTISRYRLRLRAHMAMDRIAGGESNLAGLAADLGFADQSHMTRALKCELHVTPRRLRQMLGRSWYGP